MNLFAGEPNGKKFRAAVDRRSKSKEDGASFGALLIGAAEESLLTETLDARRSARGGVGAHHQELRCDFFPTQLRRVNRCDTAGRR